MSRSTPVAKSDTIYIRIRLYDVTLLFLFKGHMKNDCNKIFNLLKMSTDGNNIWNAEDLDRASMKNNAEFIVLLRVEGKYWCGWSEGLSTLYCDLDSDIIKANHGFIPGEDD